ncbi:YicC/YloC family endoribonuclease [Draconibacterium sp. IB214405]|uniref:YicC/YloC family endoribonuclease n=1 Tax=Draconibacterium sp. IB214405 TaxID=3097352 RepID=UPI002A137157|nr:YicC/YloC family endoribonuclease [Draconibacterium sp. IB214405]MDX8338395.1 YicC/YloC family endoribonuclease [Draconibacterium sp. IB214405]
MIKSMTGFGKAEFEVNNKKITIEIKSLNSKQIDINTRTPALYREKDIIIRKAIAEKLMRGKVDFNIYVENLGDETNSKINESILKGYYHHLSDISKELGLDVDQSTLQAAMRLPDVVKTEYETLDESEWETIYANILAALSDINDFRATEGEALEADILGNVESISNLLKQIEPFEKQRIDALKVRLTDNLEALKMNGNVDENRFEQELIFYLEKLDINEEKVRLANHCEYFFETAKQNGALGKKLGFISQEIGREINTIGSKANETNIQRIVVQMKDHLERVKEQLLNVL